MAGYQTIFERQIKPMITFRQAQQSDLETLVKMLANDPLGAQREHAQSPLKQAYFNAFKSIDTDPNNELVVAIKSDQIIAMLQLTFIPYLTYQGSWRCLIEGVRVHQDFRGQGVGKQVFQWAINRAQEKHCHLLQLTSDKQRPDAIRFYESLGFRASHEGFKLNLV